MACKNIDTSQYTLFWRNLQESDNNDKERIIMTRNGEENPIISVKSDMRR